MTVLANDTLAEILWKLQRKFYFLFQRRKPSDSKFLLFLARAMMPGAELAILQPWMKGQENYRDEGPDLIE